MKNPLSTVVPIVLLGLLASCASQEAAETQSEVAEMETQGGKAATEMQQAGTAAVEQSQAAVQQGQAAVEEAAAGGIANTEQTVASLANPSVSAEELEKQLSALSPEQLTSLADNLLAMLEQNTSVMDALTKQLGQTTNSAQLGGLRQQLESTTGVVNALKDKLHAVTAQLSGTGVDVSKWTSALGA